MSALSLQQVARALGGEVCGNQVQVPGPGHSSKDRSLSVKLDAGAPDGFLVYSFAGDDPMVCRDYVRQRLGLPAFASSGVKPRRRLPAPGPAPEPEPDDRALELWHASTPLEGSLAAFYLREHRGISAPLPPTLRFVASAHYPRRHIYLPALIAALSRPDKKIVAVQLTYLNARTGAKACISAPRITVGRMGTGAVRLAAAGAILGLAEGVETALSATELHGVPCWATLGGQRLSKITLPAEVKTVHVFADNDEPGKVAAERAAHRYTSEGKHVTLHFPPKMRGDFSDTLLARRAAA